MVAVVGRCTVVAVVGRWWGVVESGGGERCKIAVEALADGRARSG